MKSLESERKNQPQDGRKTDFINIMLRSEIDEIAKKTATKGITQNEMIGQLFMFFAAGYGTTTAAISVVLFYLAKYPGYISEIRKEVKIIKIVDSSSFSLDNLPFTSSVLNESLRNGFEDITIGYFTVKFKDLVSKSKSD